MAWGTQRMTSFEFVFGLISVITSLALTRMLSGCVALYRYADRVRLSWRHAFWVATAFMLVIGNWAGFWRFHGKQVWQTLDVLVPLLFASVLYAFCDMVVPELQVETKTMDLREYHVNEGRRYKLLQLVFAALALLVITRDASSPGQWLQKSTFAILAALIVTVALRARSIWLDTASAIALTALAVIFMVKNLQVISA